MLINISLKNFKINFYGILIHMIVGMDEVGRGAWAGPLVVGAVELGPSIYGLKDSKILSKSKRHELALQIYRTAQFTGIGMASTLEIDKLGLSGAHFLAYHRAAASLKNDKAIIIDGPINYLPDMPNVKCTVRADNTVPAVSAASIIAKVYRDNLMAEFAKQHPNYGFEKHVGYGTADHAESLSKYGITAFHRKSYKPIKAFLDGTA